MSEAEEAVGELLDAIISAVCSASEWDVTCKAISLRQSCRKPDHFHGLPEHSLAGGSSGLAASGGASTGGVPAGRVDVHSILALLPPSCVVTAFTLRSSRTGVVQLKCVEQQASGYCGHYALFFALCSLELCRAESRRCAEGYLREISNSAAFWRRYWLSVGELCRHVDCSGGHLWWPWTKEHIRSGDMERSFLSHLLSCDHHLRSLAQQEGRSRVVVLHYAYGLLQTSHEDICGIQKQITDFRLSPNSTHLVFILGVTNHWVTLLAYKSCDSSHDPSHDQLSDQLDSQVSHDVLQRSHDNPQLSHDKSCDRHRVGLLYLDSNNAAVLMASEDCIQKLLQEREVKRKKRKKGKGYTDWQRENYLQAYRDQRDVVKLIADCLHGEKDLIAEKMRLSWNNVISSYEQYVIELLVEDSDHDVYLMVLVQWLEQHCHPSSLQEHHAGMLRQHGVGRLGLEGLARLARWVQHCLKWLRGGKLRVTGIQIVDRFSTVVQEIDEMCSEQCV